MRKTISRTTKRVPRRGSCAVPASVPYEPWLIEQLEDPAHAAGYLEAVIEDGDQGAILKATGLRIAVKPIERKAA